jgi:hypothetical protein
MRFLGNAGNNQRFFHDRKAKGDAARTPAVHFVAAQEVGVGIPDAGNERPQETVEFVPCHPFLGNGIQDAVKAAVERDPASSVDVGIRVGALEDFRKLSGVLHQLGAAEGARFWGALYRFGLCVGLS